MAEFFDCGGLGKTAPNSAFLLRFFLIGYEVQTKHRNTVTANFQYLQDNITLSDEKVLNNLFQVDVLDSLEMGEIRSQTTDYDKIVLLLQFILRTTEEQFEKFLEVLNKTNHMHVCRQLGGML